MKSEHCFLKRILFGFDHFYFFRYIQFIIMYLPNVHLSFVFDKGVDMKWGKDVCTDEPPPPNWELHSDALYRSSERVKKNQKQSTKNKFHGQLCFLLWNRKWFYVSNQKHSDPVLPMQIVAPFKNDCLVHLVMRKVAHVDFFKNV